MSGTDIWIRSLVKQYDRASSPALDHLDLEVRSGEFFGLLGPNGAGKTSLISILTGVVHATSGEVRIREMDLAHDADRIRQLIGLVPQEIALYDVLTAWENLTIFGRLQGLTKKQVKEQGGPLLARVGLLERAHEQVQHWSGGMQRRLNLIIALIHKPAILFLDEPTVGIDVQSRTAIWGLLEEVNQAGTTVVYTSHHLEEAERLCDRVVIMDNGKTVGQVERPADGQSSERLEEIFLRITGRDLRDQ